MEKKKFKLPSLHTNLDAFTPATDEEKAQLQEMFEKKGKALMEQEQGIASYEIIDETISEDGLTAVVNAKITYGSGKVDEDNKFNFVKVNDEWKQAPLKK